MIRIKNPDYLELSKVAKDKRSLIRIDTYYIFLQSKEHPFAFERSSYRRTQLISTIIWSGLTRA